MRWLVEPLAGINWLVSKDEALADTCSGESTLNHCKWPFGLKVCDCNGGLVVTL